jgi:hypothetical protein
MKIDWSNSGTYVWGVLGLVVFIILLRLFLRWIFSVDRQLKTQKAIALLLIEIAKKQEVDKAVISGIKSQYDLNPE